MLNYFSDILSTLYPWVKGFHIIAVISWMAGLFYLPRLFVYHVEKGSGKEELDSIFQLMELKLLRIIMNPAMIISWICGILLYLTPGIVDWSLYWPWLKLFGVIAMTWFHMWLAKRRKIFIQGNNLLTGKQYRLMNEIPTVLMVLIVFSVVVKF